MEDLCGKTFQKSFKLSSKSGWRNIVCISHMFNLVSFKCKFKFNLVSFKCKNLPSVFVQPLPVEDLLELPGLKKNKRKFDFAIEKPLRKSA